MEKLELILYVSKTSPDCVKLLSDENFIKLHTEVFKDSLKIVNIESNKELLQLVKTSRFTKVPILLGNIEDSFQESYKIMNYLRDLGANITREKLKKSAESLGTQEVKLNPIKTKLLSMKPNSIDMDTISQYEIAIVNNKQQIGDSIFKQLENIITVVEVNDSNLEIVYELFKDKGDIPYVVIASPSFYKTILAIHNYLVGNMPISDIHCTQKIKEILQKYRIYELKE